MLVDAEGVFVAFQRPFLLSAEIYVHATELAERMRFITATYRCWSLLHSADVCCCFQQKPDITLAGIFNEK